MSRVTVEGCGAVSAAGWGVEALLAAVDAAARPEISWLERTTERGDLVRTPVARVPELVEKERLPKAARLRRASVVGRFAAAAMVEALGAERLAASQRGELRLGVVCSMMNGCVNYSNRFFGEVLADPAVASPILFPETVYNAPSSHLSALAGSTAPNDTLVGDGAEFFTALELAAEWLVRGDCDGVVVVAPEELDWLSAEALAIYARGLAASEGAGALYLERDGTGPELLAVPDPVGFAQVGDRADALQRALAGTEEFVGNGAAWVDGRTGLAKLDRPETLLFPEWPGLRASPRMMVGEAMGAAAAMQAVVAVEWLRRGRAERALVTAVGGNEQAGACWFGR